MKKLSETKFEEFQGKRFEIVQVIEMLCEVCEKPLGKKEKQLRTVEIQSKEDLRNLLERASMHERAEIDLENGRIYLYDHDFPGDVHSECIDKL